MKASFTCYVTPVATAGQVLSHCWFKQDSEWDQLKKDIHMWARFQVFRTGRFLGCMHVNSLRGKIEEVWRTPSETLIHYLEIIGLLSCGTCFTILPGGNHP